jgi:hypothetical protein
MFTDSAAFYDPSYSTFKDYAAEAPQTAALRGSSSAIAHYI